MFRDIKLPLENIMGHWNGKLLPIQKEVSECLLKPPFSVVRLSMLSNFQHHFEISRPIEISAGPIFGEPTNKKVEKIQNFKIS